MSSNQAPGSAALTYPHYGLSVVACHWPVPAEFPQFCSCGSLHCRTPARHPIGALSPADATRDPSQLSRWWLAHPAANLAAFTDTTRIGVIELHHPELVHPANPGHLMRLLNGHYADLCPIIHAGPGRMQFLVQPGEPGAHHSQLETDPTDPFASDNPAVAMLAPDTLFLLPPSRQMSGERVRWMRRLRHASRLPAAKPLLDVLADFIETGALNDLR